jgi:hypothetical protein
MQTTLQIDDELYREAKAEAARTGVSLTRFLEEGLRLHLERRQPVPTGPHAFRVYAGGSLDARSWKEIRKAAEEAEEAHDLAKLGLAARPA